MAGLELENQNNLTGLELENQNNLAGLELENQNKDGRFGARKPK